MKYNKTHCENKVIADIIAMDESFGLTVLRNHSLDGRLGCGAGYDIIIRNSKGSYSCKYNNSRAAKENPPAPEEIIDCILMDADAYRATKSFHIFCEEFGYEEYENDYGDTFNRKAKSAYKACRKAAESLAVMYTDEEQDELFQIVRQEG